MLELKTKKELAQYAHSLASGSQIVHHRSTLYIPADYETLSTEYPPSNDRRIWLPLNRDMVRRRAAEDFSTLFSSDGELNSFAFMVAQNSIEEDDPVPALLIRTPDGLRLLMDDGTLDNPYGNFVPNAVRPMINDDEKEKKRILDTITEWVDGEEEARSLLHHLATSLCPGYSAVKYVLLLGEGRNGKGTLLKMLLALFGRDNVSSVTRQHMSEQNPVVTELNGKLLNIIFDGQAEFLKDSGTEKTLIAGEPAPIRKLYESTPTIVQTNALFIEALNHEPKSRDKSPALQKRLVRFQFPNIYALDRGFERSMLNEQALGAFLSLLVDHYVAAEELAQNLAPTQKAIQLQLEHMYINSLALQYFRALHEKGDDPLNTLPGMQLDELVSNFRRWRIQENDLGTWAEPDVAALFNPLINTERKSVRVNSAPRKVRVITSFKLEAQSFLESLEGVGDDVADEEVLALVED